MGAILLGLVCILAYAVRFSSAQSLVDSRIEVKCSWLNESAAMYPSFAAPMVIDLPQHGPPNSVEIIVTYMDRPLESQVGSRRDFPFNLMIARGSPSWDAGLRFRTVILDHKCQKVGEYDGTATDRTLGPVSWPAIADLDGDSNTIEMVHVEIDANATEVQYGTPWENGVGDYYVTAYRWNANWEGYDVYWRTLVLENVAVLRHFQLGVSIHDVDDDGIPEVVANGHVLNGQTGECWTCAEHVNYWPQVTGWSNTAMDFSQSIIGMYHVAAPVMDLDLDGKIDALVGNNVIVSYNNETAGRHKWEMSIVLPQDPTSVCVSMPAFGDFGSWDEDLGRFTRERDGILEVLCHNSGVDRHLMFTLVPTPRLVLSVRADSGGGPFTIADFDLDSNAEFSTAGGENYKVFDLECELATDDCEGEFVRWSQVSQDQSSRITGSSVFPFGFVEKTFGDTSEFSKRQEDTALRQTVAVMYGDECFMRVYDGDSGRVIYSIPAGSGTLSEHPVVADVDGDGHAEVLFMTTHALSSCTYTDNIFPGNPCAQSSNCFGNGTCHLETKTCSCGQDPAGSCPQYQTCVDDVEGRSPFCTAQSPIMESVTRRGGGIHILTETKGLWQNARPIWNSRVFNRAAIRDDGTVPRTSEWSKEYRVLNTMFENADYSFPQCEQAPCENGGECVGFQKCDCSGTEFSGDRCEIAPTTTRVSSSSVSTSTSMSTAQSVDPTATTDGEDDGSDDAGATSFLGLPEAASIGVFAGAIACCVIVLCLAVGLSIFASKRRKASARRRNSSVPSGSVHHGMSVRHSRQSRQSRAHQGNIGSSFSARQSKRKSVGNAFGSTSYQRADGNFMQQTPSSGTYIPAPARPDLTYEKGPMAFQQPAAQSTFTSHWNANSYPNQYGNEDHYQALPS